MFLSDSSNFFITILEHIFEIPDVTGPAIDSVELDFGYGTLTLRFRETVDITPIANVDLTKLFVVNATGSADAIAKRNQERNQYEKASTDKNC